MKSLIAIIEWFGPYTLDEAQSASKFDYDDGLYMVIGKLKGQRKSRLQYVGIANDLRSRLVGDHHKLPEVSREQTIWLGEVASPRTPGRKIKVTDRMLDLAEWAHAYFLQLPLNDKKTRTPPDRGIVIYNRWWRTDYETPHLRRPHGDWPDLIDYDEDCDRAKVVWFGSRQLSERRMSSWGETSDHGASSRY